MSDAAPPTETVELCDFDGCEQAPTWLSDAGHALCSYHAANAALQKLSAGERSSLVVGAWGYRPPSPPAWKVSESRRHPGWLVVIGQYDADFVAAIKAGVAPALRLWDPVLRAWIVHDNARPELERLIRRLS